MLRLDDGVHERRPFQCTNGEWRPAKPGADRWLRVRPDDVPRIGQARLICAAISVVVFATAFVVLVFDTGQRYVQPRRGLVQPTGRYVLVSERRARTFGEAVPSSCDGMSARRSLD